MIIIYIILFIFYMIHVHVSCVLFFYFINPNNDWFKDNYLELRRFFIKLHIIK